MARDYILRMIEEVGRMLAAILAHKKEGRYAEASKAVENSCDELLGLPMDFIRKSSPEDLWSLLQQGGALAFTRGIMLAELLLQDAELSDRENRLSDAMVAKLQAFCLLGECIPALSGDEHRVYTKKLSTLATELEAGSDNPYLREKIAQYRPKTVEEA